jgi:hypothetical protein
LLDWQVRVWLSDDNFVWLINEGGSWRAAKFSALIPMLNLLILVHRGQIDRLRLILPNIGNWHLFFFILTAKMMLRLLHGRIELGYLVLKLPKIA